MAEKTSIIHFVFQLIIHCDLLYSRIHFSISACPISYGKISWKLSEVRWLCCTSCPHSSNPGRSYGLQCCHKGKTAAHLGEKTLQCQATLILVQGICGILLLKVNCGICNILTIYFVYRHFGYTNCSVMLHQTTALTNWNDTIRPIRC